MKAGFLSKHHPYPLAEQLRGGGSGRRGTPA